MPQIKWIASNLKENNRFNTSILDATQSSPLDALARDALTTGAMTIYSGNTIFSSIIAINKNIIISSIKDVNFDNDVFMPINFNVAIIAPAICSENLNARE
ncbi:hypothetical protein I5682_03700 [Citrobacter werkmanii]|nr:hypothetical protein [Citrobacter werkmanii]MBJ9597473.1 hypothetical protein [Citrobacter werkmanii]MBJ9871602.1 hypothetical protein [Citrobacter werkmanii]HEB0852344.1 hypothetical protein [Citrobacter freundii]